MLHVAFLHWFQSPHTVKSIAQQDVFRLTMSCDLCIQIAAAGSLQPSSKYALHKLESLQVEQDLKFARFLAGLHGPKARKEVGELMNAVVEAGAALPLTEDKLVTLMEAAQVSQLVCKAPSNTNIVMSA